MFGLRSELGYKMNKRGDFIHTKIQMSLVAVEHIAIFPHKNIIQSKRPVDWDT